jgi:hypothetical protein
MLSVVFNSIYCGPGKAGRVAHITPKIQPPRQPPAKQNTEHWWGTVYWSGGQVVAVDQRLDSFDEKQ